MALVMHPCKCVSLRSGRLSPGSAGVLRFPGASAEVVSVKHAAGRSVRGVYVCDMLAMAYPCHWASLREVPSSKGCAATTQPTNQENAHQLYTPFPD